jgi:hypothetical protein
MRFLRTSYAGGIVNAAIPAPASKPRAKTSAPITICSGPQVAMPYGLARLREPWRCGIRTPRGTGDHRPSGERGAAISDPSSGAEYRHARATRRQSHRRTIVELFSTLCHGRERPNLALSFGWARRYAQIRSSSSTVNSVFGFGLPERARNSSMRLLKSASYSAAVIGLGLGMFSQART